MYLQPETKNQWPCQQQVHSNFSHELIDFPRATQPKLYRRSCICCCFVKSPISTLAPLGAKSKQFPLNTLSLILHYCSHNVPVMRSHKFVITMVIIVITISKFHTLSASLISSLLTFTRSLSLSSFCSTFARPLFLYCVREFLRFINCFVLCVAITAYDSLLIYCSIFVLACGQKFNKVLNLVYVSINLSIYCCYIVSLTLAKVSQLLLRTEQIGRKLDRKFDIQLIFIQFVQ